MPDPVAPALAPAGIVREPGVDDKLDKVYEALDAQEFRNRFLEGEQLKPQEFERRKALLTQIAREANVRLNGRVTILGARPEVMGFGARFYGTDSDRRDYTIDFHVGAEDRMASAPDDRERDVRETVGLIVEEVLKQRTRYLERMTGERQT